MPSKRSPLHSWGKAVETIDGALALVQRVKAMAETVQRELDLAREYLDELIKDLDLGVADEQTDEAADATR